MPRNLKATSVTSWKPSRVCGGLNRAANPVNANLGRISRFSGFIALFNARTASLCSHTICGTENQIHRIGTVCLAARSIHSLRTSGSGFVLSAMSVSFLPSFLFSSSSPLSLHFTFIFHIFPLFFYHACFLELVCLPIATDFPSFSSSRAACKHRSRVFSVS